MTTAGKIRRCLMGALAALLLAAASAHPVFDGIRRVDTDVLHLLRAMSSSPSNGAPRSRVAVVAIDEETHAAPSFAGLPKVMWTPQMATVQDAVLGGGALVFGWDIILPTSAATYVADRRFDAALLKSLASARREQRVVLGTAHFGQTRIEPHRLFTWTVGGAANLRSLNVSPDFDGIVRRVPIYLPNIRQEEFD